jgi:hypothetical protein
MGAMLDRRDMGADRRKISPSSRFELDGTARRTRAMDRRWGCWFTVAPRSMRRLCLVSIAIHSGCSPG